ncbi:GTD2A protein, partial [Amia calva]|nr:GTD2A protein [Amia calva]
MLGYTVKSVEFKIREIMLSNESVDTSSTAQLMVFIRMVFNDFSVKEELLTLLPLKTTTRGVDIYDAVKGYFMERNIPLEKLVSVTTYRDQILFSLTVQNCHTGFVARCRGDANFLKFLHYYCIIHQQAMCAKVMGFDHVITPVIHRRTARRTRKQHRSFKVLLEELLGEYGDLLLHTEIQWLSRGRILQGEIKVFMESRGEDTSLLQDTIKVYILNQNNCINWLLDLAFLTDITGKLNHLNCELQGKGKT